MRYDGIWIKRGRHLVRWHESIQGKNKSVGDDFADDFERLYRQGHVVLLVPGKNCDLDELFLFETAAEALAFYSSDLDDFESFIGDEREPCGFREVSLFYGGRRIATKSCEPTERLETQHQ
jgi:hypothetical protein